MRTGTKRYVERGITHSQRYYYTQAINDFTQAIQLKPDYLTAYFKRGDAYQFTNHFSQAIDNYNQAIQIQSDNPYLYNNRGVNYLYNSNYQNAIKDFGKALEVRPDYTDAFFKLGVADAKNNEFDKARDRFQAILNSSKDQVLRGKAQEALNGLQRTSTNLPEPPGTLSPRIRIIYTNSKDAIRASKLKEELIAQGYNVEGLEFQKKNTPGYGQYYHRQDEDDAEKN